MHVQWFFPTMVAFAISFCTSMVGVSGAFLLVPYQMSVLGFTGPAVSGTNLVFNLVAIPSGVYRYGRERRIVWPLAVVLLAGTTPGVIVGGFIRLSLLRDVQRFKAFVGCVLLWIAFRLLYDVWKGRDKAECPVAKGEETRTLEFTPRALLYEFRGQRYQCKPAGIFCLSLAVGLVGGIYGIGGGAIIAPLLVAIYGLSVHTIAGATLLGTFATSAIGTGFYQLISPFYQRIGLAVAPDWNLGIRLGIGGMAGMYLGARTQRHIRAPYLKVFLAVVLFASGSTYLGSYLRISTHAPYILSILVLALTVGIWVRHARQQRRNRRAAHVGK